MSSDNSTDVAAPATATADSAAGSNNPSPAASTATATPTPAIAAAESASDESKPKGRLRGRRRAEAEGAVATGEGGNEVAAPSGATPAATPAPSASQPRVPQRVVRLAPQVPQDLLDNPDLAAAIGVLPSNYNFEVYKTLWRLREARAKMVALQFPEGLLMYACVISDILSRFGGVQTVIMGDVTYGACCVDDYTARALGCDFMVHYGHSCLVPIDVSTIRMLYVFVDITLDTSHLVRSMRAHFPPESRLVLAGTIQFATALANVAHELQGHYKELLVPQARPLSKGEVLGCTSPKFGDFDAVIFLADGRFHLESMMIHNPHIPHFFKYDPYSRKLTRESYDHAQMLQIRHEAVEKARGAECWGLILGTLGRQGNGKILARLERMLRERGKKVVTLLLSEVFPDKLARMSEVQAWIQVACPRLSIDWGYAFPVPLLSPYEAEVCLGSTDWRAVYPMDFYSDEGGSWSNYHPENKQTLQSHAKGVNPVRARREAKAAAAAAAAAVAGEAAKLQIAYSEE